MNYSREKILSLIDLTSLNDNDNEQHIRLLCEKAITPLGSVAAVCIYPKFLKQVVPFFKKTQVSVATVANFPSGSETLENVFRTIQEAILDGAQEIDVVFPYMQYLSGDKVGAQQFILACREVCGKNILLKVILETGALKDPSIITEVSRNVILAGADFLKTSTGKMPIGATIEAARAMLHVIKEFTVGGIPRPLGFKASGGVRTVEDASAYITLASEIMGKDWIEPAHFRIGASQLVDTLIVH